MVLMILDADELLTVSSKLNFVGQPDEVKEVQTFNGNTTTLVRTYKYYDSGQLQEVTAQLNTNPVETLASYTYDALGHVLQKNYGGTDQKQHYEYNIRGWLSKINEPNTAGADFFAMSLAYNAPEVAGADVKPQYGGNIASMVWRTKMVDGTQNKKGYGFAYDGLDRLNVGAYAKDNGSGTLVADEAYAENIPLYDENGNIRTLVRKNGSKEATTYGYTYSGNQLSKITLNGVDKNPYIYDANGNATTDGRNGFAIQYNELNLPRSVSKGGQSVSYTYDATGAKLAVANPDGTARYYHGSMVYDQRKRLAYALHEEGMVLGNGTYQYNLKDHLGNTRAMFSKAAGAGQTPALAQATDYYPFGKSFDNVNVPQNRYLYNGKELQDQYIGGTPFGWYDYGARFYDPELGVWHTMDPLAEKYRRWSPYNYCVDNPLRFTDPDGMDIWNINENGGIQYVKNTKKDQINIVNSDGIKKSSIEFKYGTIHNKEMKYQDEKGNEKNMTFLNITGDNNGKKVFEFLANGTKVEWGHLKVGKSDGEKGENLIATGSSETSKENANESSNAAGAVVKGYGYNIREFNHNHPNGTLPSNSDINLRDKYPGTKLNVYTDGHYIPYTTTADLMRIAYLEALRENGVKIY
nr:JAB-like toxin 1 domain-containing protein [uncultured Acetobacteroides sp.]